MLKRWRDRLFLWLFEENLEKVAKGLEAALDLVPIEVLKRRLLERLRALGPKQASLVQAIVESDLKVLEESSVEGSKKGYLGEVLSRLSSRGL